MHTHTYIHTLMLDLGGQAKLAYKYPTLREHWTHQYSYLHSHLLELEIGRENRREEEEKGDLEEENHH